MTQDEVFDMAKAAGFMQHRGVIAIPNIQCLERFAALVTAPLQERIQDLYKQLNEAERGLDSQYKLGMEFEREECAKVCEEVLEQYRGTAMGKHAELVGDDCADAIRARGNT
jgi:hypothetical protein